LWFGASAFIRIYLYTVRHVVAHLVWLCVEHITAIIYLFQYKYLLNCDSLAVTTVIITSGRSSPFVLLWMPLFLPRRVEDCWCITMAVSMLPCGVAAYIPPSTVVTCVCGFVSTVLPMSVWASALSAVIISIRIYHNMLLIFSSELLHRSEWS